MKESGKEYLKQAIYESTLSTAPRSPFPDGEGKLVAALPQYKFGDARRFAIAGFPRIVSPLAGKVPRRGG